MWKCDILIVVMLCYCKGMRHKSWPHWLKMSDFSTSLQFIPRLKETKISSNWSMLWSWSWSGQQWCLPHHFISHTLLGHASFPLRLPKPPFFTLELFDWSLRLEEVFNLKPNSDFQGWNPLESRSWQLRIQAREATEGRGTELEPKIGQSHWDPPPSPHPLQPNLSQCTQLCSEEEDEREKYHTELSFHPPRSLLWWYKQTVKSDGWRKTEEEEGGGQNWNMLCKAGQRNSKTLGHSRTD